MFRTRDVLLALVSIGFVLIILVSQLGRVANHQSLPEYAIPDTAPIETIGIEVVMKEDKREELISEWRERLRDFVLPAIDVVEVAMIDEGSEAEDVTAGVDGVFSCNDYRTYNNQIAKLFSFEAEGVRVFSTIEQVDLVDGSNTFLVMPVRIGQVADGQFCVPTDVIGIANNGTLIRNNQVVGYGVFEPDTLIGYALDGFPIYGRLPASQLDVCGGRITPGGYQYHIATERADIIRCFVASPVLLP